jgi:hypothetical protein
MNPPFALKGSLDQEYRFVSRALSFMADGGLLFSLLPLDAMFGTHEEKTWRVNELLAKHTLLAVISFPDESFYPAAQKQVVGIIVKKGIPHPKEQAVFWARIAHDGHVKLKSRRLPASELLLPRNEPNEMSVVIPSLRSFVAHPGTVAVNEPMLYKTAPIDYRDPLLELVPEAYLDSKTPSQQEIERAVDDLARETAAFLIRFRKEALVEEFDADA